MILFNASSFFFDNTTFLSAILTTRSTVSFLSSTFRVSTRRAAAATSEVTYKPDDVSGFMQDSQTSVAGVTLMVLA